MEKDKRKNYDESLSETVKTADMVKTLDGRIVSKKDIKDGEIYINAEGKKVRKVVKKVVKETNKTDQKIVEESQSDVPQESFVQEKYKSAEEVRANRNGDPKDFLDRVNAKHSFLERMRKNEKISAPKMAELEAETVDEEPSVVEEAIEDVNNVAVDSSVSELETAVLDENYANSIGKGSNYASANIGGESSISGLATNPNADPKMIMSQAGKPISQSLAGNQVKLPTPVNAKTKLVKPKKKRKPIKLWIPMVALAGVYLVVCLVYFFTCYNFGDKSIDIGKYYIAIGDEAKKEYYDGEQFNFYELVMTYYWAEENVEEYDLTKLHIVEPTKSMGYTLNNGYISAIWDGDYASDDVLYRDVNVKFLYKDETCFVPVRIYKNILTSLKCYSSVQDLYGAKGGDTIAVTVFGVYTNKVLEESGLGSIDRKLDPTEYNLWIHIKASDIGSMRAKLEFDEKSHKYVLPSKVGNITIRYVDEALYPADEITITANAIDNYDISCFTYDKFSVNTYEEIQNPSIQKENRSYTIQTINSQLSAEKTEAKDARYNQPFTFSVRPNYEQGYTLRQGASVSYNVKDEKGNYKYSEFKTLSADELNNYRIEREEVTGEIVIKVDKCLNTYNAVFYTKASASAEYTQYETLEFVKGANISKPNDPQSTTYFTFTGWAERFSDGTLGEIITDWTTVLMGTTDRVFEAQYEYSNSSVTYASAGYEITDLSGNKITSITYGEALEFKLRLLPNYSFGGENVTLYYKTADGVYKQVFPVGHNTSQEYDADDRYIIDGENLTGDLTFDLDMRYTVSTTETSYTINITEIRRVLNTAVSDAHITITLKNGYSASETPVLTYNGITANYCSMHTHTGNKTYCYKINKALITDNVNIEVSGIEMTYTIVAEGEAGDEVNFTITDTEGTGISTATLSDNEDFEFKIQVDDGYNMEDATVVAVIDGVSTELSAIDGVYSLDNSKFNGITSTITIKVTGISEEGMI